LHHGINVFLGWLIFERCEDVHTVFTAVLEFTRDRIQIKLLGISLLYSIFFILSNDLLLLKFLGSGFDPVALY